MNRRFDASVDHARQEFENNLKKLPEHKLLGDLLLDLSFSPYDRNILGDEYF